MILTFFIVYFIRLIFTWKFWRNLYIKKHYLYDTFLMLLSTVPFLGIVLIVNLTPEIINEKTKKKIMNKIFLIKEEK